MIWLGVIGGFGGLIGGFGVAWGLSRSITRLSVRLRDVHAHLDHEVGSLRLTAEGGNLQCMEQQAGTILNACVRWWGNFSGSEREIATYGTTRSGGAAGRQHCTKFATRSPASNSGWGRV